MIQYIAQDVKMPDIKKRRLNNWIKAVSAKYDKTVGDLAYIFCSDDALLKINIKYLNHDYYTDIITFSYGNEHIISGDIFISTETIQSNALKYGVSFDEELHRVMIHGILHLCGQDDCTPEERTVMQQKENDSLDILEKMF
jgi:rRNA maturation RNase YbeY